MNSSDRNVGFFFSFPYTVCAMLAGKIASLCAYPALFLMVFIESC